MRTVRCLCPGGFRGRPSARLERRTVAVALAAVLGAALALACGCMPAQADGGTARFSLRPVTYDPSMPTTQSYFIFDSQQGAVVESSVRVTNSGDASGTVRLYPADATTGATSGLVYGSETDPKQDVGAWLTLGAQTVTLAPGESQVVPFTAAVPLDARPGQHVGGIVAEDLALATGAPASSVQINIRRLTIVAVQFNLPGQTVEQMQVTSAQSGGVNGSQQVLIGLSNTGDTMLKPSGTLELSDGQGRVLTTIPVQLDTFLPQTAIVYPVTMSGPALGPGTYTATVSLTYGDQGAALTWSGDFSITPRQIAEVFGSRATAAPALPSADATGTFASGVPHALLTFALLLLVVVAAALGLLARARRGQSQPATALQRRVMVAPRREAARERTRTSLPPIPLTASRRLPHDAALPQPPVSRPPVSRPPVSRPPVSRPTPHATVSRAASASTDVRHLALAYGRPSGAHPDSQPPRYEAWEELPPLD